MEPTLSLTTDRFWIQDLALEAPEPGPNVGKWVVTTRTTWMRFKRQ